MKHWERIEIKNIEKATDGLKEELKSEIHEQCEERRRENVAMVENINALYGGREYRYLKRALDNLKKYNRKPNVITKGLEGEDRTVDTFTDAVKNLSIKHRSLNHFLYFFLFFFLPFFLPGSFRFSRIMKMIKSFDSNLFCSNLRAPVKI